jgi:hypothetical protein
MLVWMERRTMSLQQKSTQHPFLSGRKLQTDTHPNRQYQGCEIGKYVKHSLGVEICFFIHATTWNVEIPRAGNG